MRTPLIVTRRHPTLATRLARPETNRIVPPAATGRMDTEGQFAPVSAAEARERYDAFGPTAQVVVKEVAKAMGLDPETSRSESPARSSKPLATCCRESLADQVGSMAEFEEWREDTDCEVTLVGAENVDNVSGTPRPSRSRPSRRRFGRTSRCCRDAPSPGLRPHLPRGHRCARSHGTPYGPPVPSEATR